MKRKIGLIGLGFIGSFYAQKLLEAGFPLSVFDIDREKVEKAIDAGAKAAAAYDELTKASDVIILSLPGSEIVEEVMSGPGGVLSVLQEGQLVIDTSTCRPATAVKCQKLCAEKKAGFVDSPLTRRKQGQILMAGGSEKDFAAAEEILACISYKYKHIGPAGHGQYLKMINQALMGNILAAGAEAVELSKKCGIDPLLIRDYLEFDIHNSFYSGDYAGGGNLAIHYKDLGYLNEIAHDVKANIPISALVHELFKATMPYGDPNWIQAGIQTYYKRLNDPGYKPGT